MIGTRFGSALASFGKLRNLWAQGSAAIAMEAPFLMAREKQRMRTGGPDDDEDDELRRLMPILAAVITIAVVFGG